MKKVAGVEMFWRGQGTSREEYEIAITVTKLFDLIMDETIKVWRDSTIRELGGWHVSKMTESLLFFCICVKNNDVDMCFAQLRTFEENILNVSAIIRNRISENRACFRDTDKTVFFGNYHNDCWYDSWCDDQATFITEGENLVDLTKRITILRGLSDKTRKCIELLQKMRKEYHTDIFIFEDMSNNENFKELEFICGYDDGNNQFCLYSKDRLLSYNLIKREILIGRNAERVDIVIDNSRVSRVHARMSYSLGEYEIEDLNSSNGTFVNGVKLSTCLKLPLHDGDEIRVGDETIMYMRKWCEY